MVKSIHCAVLCFYLFFESVFAQKMVKTDSIKFSYSIVETPYGDYFGKITLRKVGQNYRGELIDDDNGGSHTLKVIKYDGKQFDFALKFDGSKSTFKCTIFGDSLIGTGTLKREDFRFLLKGKIIRD